MNGFWEWNLQVLTTIAEHRIPIFDTLFAAVTWAGSDFVVVALMCLFFLCIDKKKGYQLGIVFFLGSAIGQGLKILFRIERPWVLVDTKYTAFKGKYSALDKFGTLKGATGYSFPSGHATSSMSFFGFFGAETKKLWLKIACFTLVALVSFSRIYLGVHTPFDIAAALVIVGLIILLVDRVFDRVYDDRKYDPAVSAVVGGVSVLSVALSVIVWKSGGAEYSMIADNLKMASCGISFSIGYLLDRRFIGFEPKEGTLWQKALRMVAGVGGVFAIKEGLKALGRVIFGEGRMLPLVDVTRYLLLMFYGICILPWLIMKIRKMNARKKDNV